MKSIIYIISVLTVLVASSCNKNYQCECMWASSSMNDAMVLNSQTRLSLEDAKTWCSGNQDKNISCRLK